MQNIFVIGAGTMGHGIAQVFAMNGLTVFLYDQNQEALKKAQQHISDNLSGGVSRGKITESDKIAALTRLKCVENIHDCADADVVIEAVVENMAVKKAIFQEVSSIVKSTCIVASNTSSLSISAMAAAAQHPQRVIGLHFFNPVHIMKLVEIVRGEQTDEVTLQQALQLVKQIGKTSVVVKDSPGFATSRLGICLGNEAMRMVEQGVASAADIDQAMVLGYGHPVGPLQLTDRVGLDVRLAITTALYQELGTEGFKPPKILQEMVAAGKLGKKSGQGFYRWEGDKVSS